MLICIDAGHDDSNVNGSPDKTYYEHEFALDVAKRVQALLNVRGIQTLLTRPDEGAVSLSERCTTANKAKADLFLSIHTNAAGEKGWYVADDGLRWNTAEGWSAHVVLKGYEAEKLAKAIHAVAIPLLGCKDRGVVQSESLYVLKNTTMPAVLIEHGFHTSKSEVEKLKSSEYRALCAEATARGICNYAGVAWEAAAAEGKTITIDELKQMGYTGINLGI